MLHLSLTLYIYTNCLLSTLTDEEYNTPEVEEMLDRMDLYYQHLTEEEIEYAQTILSRKDK